MGGDYVLVINKTSNKQKAQEMFKVLNNALCS